MIDITKNHLYIKRIINVWRSELKNCKNKPIYVDGRHSDALVYVLSGSCTYYFANGREFCVNTGDILYLAKGAVYRMNVNVDSHKYIYTDFEFDSDQVRKSDYYSDIIGAENLFIKLLGAHKVGFAKCASVLYSIYGEVISQSGKRPGARGEVAVAKEYIDRNFSDLSLGITDLAQMCSISEVYFRRLFKERYGISPSQYIILKRIEHSKSLLMHSFITEDECAVQSGFASAQYFCRVFKKAVEMTPGEYRKR